ncbi:lectin-like [Protopterus annectens]|uniref:lectin-like n=1 Tax=Protopterus annectens TaxID=7888 RepID=UPI001CFB0D51|nr:lectin-like [Protopterus annectens]XP_043939968.1 lectin-like [Protopterus annectens]
MDKMARLVFTLLLFTLGFGIKVEVANFPRWVCADGWTLFQGYCYKFFDVKKSWNEAENICKNTVKGAHLTSISSDVQNKFLVQLTKAMDKSIPTAWTGGNDFTKKYTWTWVDGKSFSYTHWSKGEPTNLGGHEECLQINWLVPGQWNNEMCSAALPFICCYYPISFEVNETP